MSKRVPKTNLQARSDKQLKKLYDEINDEIQRRKTVEDGKWIKTLVSVHGFALTSSEKALDGLKAFEIDCPVRLCSTAWMGCKAGREELDDNHFVCEYDSSDLEDLIVSNKFIHYIRFKDKLRQLAPYAFLCPNEPYRGRSKFTHTRVSDWTCSQEKMYADGSAKILVQYKPFKAGTKQGFGYNTTSNENVIFMDYGNEMFLFSSIVPYIVTVDALRKAWIASNCDKTFDVEEQPWVCCGVVTSDSFEKMRNSVIPILACKNE